MVESEAIADIDFKLIVTIIKKGEATRVVAASKKAGAKGGTIFYGRGTAKKIDLSGLVGHEL